MMLKSTDQRLAALQKAGFKMPKYRELKSGAQYKILTPKAIRKLWPVIIVRDSIEKAVAFAEGVAATWKVVQQKMDRQIAAMPTILSWKMHMVMHMKPPLFRQARKTSANSRKTFNILKTN